MRAKGRAVGFLPSPAVLLLAQQLRCMVGTLHRTGMGRSGLTASPTGRLTPIKETV
jgi:hypothetical protein